VASLAYLHGMLGHPKPLVGVGSHPVKGGYTYFLHEMGLDIDQEDSRPISESYLSIFFVVIFAQT
jgi:hypothetical protein